VLPEDERLELASEIIASVDVPRDADWDAAWLGGRACEAPLLFSRTDPIVAA
jgi:hypothetical protein